MGACVNSAVNMADFLIRDIQRGTAVVKVGRCGATRRSGLAAGDPGTGQALPPREPVLGVCLQPWAAGVLPRCLFLLRRFTLAPAVAPARDDPLGVGRLQRVDAGRSLPRGRGREGGDRQVGLDQIVSGAVLIQRVRANGLLQTQRGLCYGTSRAFRKLTVS